MRHRKGNRKISLPTDQRVALLRNLALSLFKYNRIETTVTKAKEVSKFAARIITAAKKGDISSKRRVIAKLNNEKDVVKNIYSNVEKFKGRNGGYTRIIRSGVRRGDSAEMAIVELVDTVVAGA